MRVEQRDGQAVFTCDTFAWRVCLDLDGEQPFADNFFDVLPGIPYAVPWPDALGAPRVLDTGNAALRAHRA